MNKIKLSVHVWMEQLQLTLFLQDALCRYESDMQKFGKQLECALLEYYLCGVTKNLNIISAGISTMQD